MPKPATPSERRTGWATVSEAAAIFGLSPQAVRQTYIPALNAIDVDARRPLRVRVSAIVNLIVDRKVQERLRAPVDDDPFLSGDSPALERYRLAKAQHAELDLELRKGELIDLGKCRDVLGRWAVIIRRMGEHIGKRFGPEASATVHDALAECEAAITAQLGDGNDTT